MTSSGPPVGTIVYLRPEDTTADIGDGCYARVGSLSDQSVVVMAVDSGVTPEPITVDGQVALTRVVPTSELGGSQLSTSLRKGVACFVDSAVRFGQVVTTTVNQVQVNLSQGAVWVDEAQVLGVVHPLMAILLYDAALPEDEWSSARVCNTNESIQEALRDNATGGRLPSASYLLEVMASGMARDAPVAGLRQWIEPLTGKMRITSVDYAVRYTYYVSGKRSVPMLIRWAIGESICADPACVVAAPSAAKRQCRRTFLGSETSYDDQCEDGQAAGEDEEEKTKDVQEDPPVGSVRTASRMTPSAGRFREPTSAVANRLRTTVDITEAEGALLERLARDPEGYRLYLQLRTASASVTGGGKRQSKQAFLPDDSQIVVHKGITPVELQGTSPAEFVQRLMSPSVIPFTTHPAVLMRMYEYAFGLRGLSVMHLVALTMEERMRAQRDQSVNYNDFSGTVKLPRAKVSLSWGDLQDGVNGLVVYSSAFCDMVTRELAIAVSMFVSSMRAYNNWPVSKLYALEYWINNQLGDYREMVAADAGHGTDSRGEVAKRFDPWNPKLLSLQLGHMQERAAEEQAQQADAAPAQPTRSAGHGNQVVRTMPSNVVAAIPRRDGWELCLKYVSRKGCKDGANGRCSFSDRGHFDDVELPAVVRAYVVAKLRPTPTHDRTRLLDPPTTRGFCTSTSTSM